jgi:hypothetical protein
MRSVCPYGFAHRHRQARGLSRERRVSQLVQLLLEPGHHTQKLLHLLLKRAHHRAGRSIHKDPIRHVRRTGAACHPRAARSVLTSCRCFPMLQARATSQGLFSLVACPPCLF